jgi:hypothetical protein
VLVLLLIVAFGSILAAQITQDHRHSDTAVT